MSAVYEQALAAITVRREMLAAGSDQPWTADEDGFLEDSRNFQIGLTTEVVTGSTGPDALLLIAAVNAYATDTDALEAVLLRHRGIVGCFTQLPVCHACSDFEERTERTWPCADAQAALTALGVTP